MNLCLGKSRLKKDQKYDPQQPKKANQIILLESQSKGTKETTIFIPVYFRFIVKNFRSMKFSTLSGQINLNFFISICVKNLPPILKAYLFRNVQINFFQDGTIKLRECPENDEVTSFEDDDYIHFTVRKCVNVKIQPYVFLTPYELVDSILTCSFRKIEIQNSNNKVVIKFNLMDNDNKQKKYNFSNDCSFGTYLLSEKRIHVEFQNKSEHLTLMELGKALYGWKMLDHRENEEEKQKEEVQKKKKEYIQYVHIHMPVYRSPLVGLSSIFSPLWVLGVINLAIFYQGPGLADRIGAIAALMIAFSGILPLIRQNLPLDSKITLLQIVIYFQMLTVLLCLIDSIKVRYEDDSYSQNFQAYQDPEYLISLIIMVIIIIFPIISYIIFRCVGIKSHHEQELFPYLQLSTDFNRDGWKSSKKGDDWFQKLDTSSMTKQYEKGQLSEKFSKKVNSLAREVEKSNVKFKALWSMKSM